MISFLRMNIVANFKAPIDIQADVSGSVLTPVFVSPKHCFKSWYREDKAAPLIDAKISHV